jgi:hypothetical protein
MAIPAARRGRQDGMKLLSDRSKHTTARVLMSGQT